ncbi:hypothetical protein E2C01_051749 [Portunus trituberculatus]|uniref:Uncharacterized protein n=1 Tax=Portunus trituberculatus TaxID=210409 RepID=A0A5B7GFQ8_PORTR|nr:hypothetical protein [Portunus trituberculatus]
MSTVKEDGVEDDSGEWKERGLSSSSSSFSLSFYYSYLSFSCSSSSSLFLMQHASRYITMDILDVTGFTVRLDSCADDMRGDLTCVVVSGWEWRVYVPKVRFDGCFGF